MIRIALRLVRLEIALAAAGIALFAVMLGTTRGYVETVAREQAAGTCADPFVLFGWVCNVQPPRMMDWIVAFDTGFLLIPIAVGVVLALGFVADLAGSGRRLLWTQSLPRQRWLAGWMLAIGGAVTALLLVALGVIRWWLAPLAKPETLTLADPAWYMVSGPAIVGWGLFAAAMTAAIGVLTRRVVPTLLLAGLVLLPLALPVGPIVINRLMAPVAMDPAEMQEPGALFVERYWIAADGTRVSEAAWWERCFPDGFHTVELERACAARDGLVAYVDVHPARHWWGLQVRETALLLLLAAALGSLVWIWTMRRME